MSVGTLLAVIEIAHLRQELAWLREAIRIKDARMERILAGRRPRYSSTERLTILELITAPGCSIRKEAAQFRISRGTILAWIRRLDVDRTVLGNYQAVR